MKKRNKKGYPAIEYDTSKTGLEKLGFHFTEKQYQDLLTVNLMCIGSAKHEPVFTMLLLLQTLGLFEKKEVDWEMIQELQRPSKEEIKEYYLKKEQERSERIEYVAIITISVITSVIMQVWVAPWLGKLFCEIIK